MKGFALNLNARYTDGVVLPLRGKVDAPLYDGEQYVCAFECPLIGGGGTFRSSYPEWAYSKAALWLRFNLEGQGFEICDAGHTTDIPVPVVDEAGMPCFPSAQFRGRVLHKGVLTDFTAEVHSPQPDPRGGWGSLVACSLYEGRLGPIHSDWPEHAYELAFTFVRNMLDYRGECRPVGYDGVPLIFRAPV